MNNETLPKDLAGYQLLVSSVIQIGDIGVEAPSIGFCPFSIDRLFVGWRTDHKGQVHVAQARSADRSYNVYRKMACPSNRDDKPSFFFQEGGAVAAIMEDERQKAKTYDDGKPPLAWLPWAGLRAVADVQAYGHSKYKDFNNYRKGMEVSRNLSCAMRHIGEYMEGRDLDDESKQSHLAHAACRILFVLQNIADGTAIDDRYKKS